MISRYSYIFIAPVISLSFFLFCRHVGILKITKDKMFKIDKIILKTVRPFYIEDVILKETEIDPTQEDMVMAYLVNKVGYIKIILKNQYYGCEDLHSFIFFYDTQIK